MWNNTELMGFCVVPWTRAAQTVLEEMVVEYFDRKQSDDLYDAELGGVLRSVAAEAMAESIWEARVLDEMAAVSIEAFVEVKLSDMVSSIATLGRE